MNSRERCSPSNQPTVYAGVWLDGRQLDQPIKDAFGSQDAN
jgi:hypothetical protein